MQCCICLCNILCCTDSMFMVFADLWVRNFFCVWNFFMHAINCIVGWENDVICPIVTIVVIGLVSCDYVRGIPTPPHQCISWSWHAAYEALLRRDTVAWSWYSVFHVLNDVWHASYIYSQISNQRGRYKVWWWCLYCQQNLPIMQFIACK
jgi:hypothetical protein